MEKSPYIVLTPPLVSNVDEKVEVDAQNKALRGFKAEQVDRAVLEGQGHTDLPAGKRIWVMDVTKVAAEDQPKVIEMAGPQHRPTRDAKFVQLDERRDMKGPTQEAAATRVGRNPNDERSASRSGMEVDGHQIYVLISEKDKFKEMMEAAGLGKMHRYNPKSGERFVDAEVPAKAPEVWAKIQAAYGEHRREAWEAQPEVQAKREATQKTYEDKKSVKGPAAAIASVMASPDALKVADSDLAVRTVSRLLEKLTSEQVAIKTYFAEKAVVENAPWHERASLQEKATGRTIISADARQLQDWHTRGMKLGLAELAFRKFEYGYDAAKGKGPTQDEMRAAFPEYYASKAQAKSAAPAERSAPKPEGAARPAGGKDRVGGSARRRQAPAR